MDTTQPNTTDPSPQELGPAPEPEPPAAEAPQAAADVNPSEAVAESATEGALSSAVDKKRIEEQLEALKRKELELRRALALADHPALSDAVRRLDGLLYALKRVEEKVDKGPSKAETRRREVIEKKLEALRAKAAELAAQIGQLEAEHATLVREREEALEHERREALEALVLSLGEHSAALSEAGLDAAELVPELGQRLPEIRQVAEQLSAARNTGAAS